MFDDQRLARQTRQEERGESGAGGVNDIARADEPPELKEARLAGHAEWKCAVLVLSRGVCVTRVISNWDAPFKSRSPEPAGERLNGRLNATDARGEKSENRSATSSPEYFHPRLVKYHP